MGTMLLGLAATALGFGGGSIAHSVLSRYDLLGFGVKAGLSRVKRRMEQREQRRREEQRDDALEWAEQASERRTPARRTPKKKASKR